MAPLRIGMIAPPWFSVPPTGYGGIERVVAMLTDGLARRGHEVTLFASGGSRTAGRLVSVFETPPSRALGDPFVEMQHLAEAYAHWRQFDVIHDHTVLGLTTGAALPVPVLHTIHGPVIEPFRSLYARLAARVRLVAISRHQRSTLADGCHAAVVYNALDPAEYEFSAKAGDYLLFVGRINPEKGVLQALEIARRARLPLLMLAKINEQSEHDYFEAVVKPALRGVDVDLLEQASHEVKMRAYRDALATLFPIQWPEPFGLVMIESMATGTPVIAFANGSVPEVVAHGETGYVCRSVEEAVRAVGTVATLDRKACRERVTRLFSAEASIDAHEALYRAAVGESLPLGPAISPSEPATGAGSTALAPAIALPAAALQ